MVETYFIIIDSFEALGGRALHIEESPTTFGKGCRSPRGIIEQI